MAKGRLAIAPVCVRRTGRRFENWWKLVDSILGNEYPNSGLTNEKKQKCFHGWLVLTVHFSRKTGEMDFFLPGTRGKR
ncbi:MAG: hypothetical protein NTX88_11600 [Candidatus Atribacteria bacterium]|nr:hypothetical protein [Candidatus Atribacteria bacterium]